MAAPYRLFGSELSPYSVKVRSYLRYKGVAHQWLARGPDTAAEFDAFAKLPLIPLLVTPDGRGLQDSTPLIEALDGDWPEPTIDPDEPVAKFVSALIEEYADEWVNKPMFHYRWSYDADARSAAARIVQGSMPALSPAEAERAADAIRARMVGRLALVGSSAATAPIIEASLQRLLAILERHLKSRPYLFGERPALGDFGLFAQLYECSTDPTPGALVEAAPAVSAWVARMLDPQVKGPFERWRDLEPTLRPLLDEEVTAVFLPWSRANAHAIQAGSATMTVDLPGGAFAQTPQRYHARSLAELGRKYAALQDKEQIHPALRAALGRLAIA
ncbi:glutathione S-transferase family protein [Chelatococcus reniformis]|uniref:Glutathione S-transferase n=1 Tax=Chelatococcus reniformis TaxID=1494448 RepID=A0A916XNJ4_9HYPH|nr:glutathione S-transferase family protein [Chelatococcus reniformis]GGC90049.1 glutathione S-transferase [Chelatococcus reniformis]